MLDVSPKQTNEKEKKLWSSSVNLAQKTAASIKSVIGKEISSHDVCRILKEEQASVFLGICYAPKMPLFKAQSGKSATPFKIAFYNDWEKRQRPKSKMIALPLMSTTPEWRFSSYFQMPFKLDRGKRPSIPASYPIYGKKCTVFYSGITCSSSLDQSICWMAQLSISNLHWWGNILIQFILDFKQPP